jgi:hypothetical protein
VGESRLVIIPHVKADAVDLSAGWFPALRKTALALRGTDSKVLPNNYPSSGRSPVSASPSERDRVTKIPQFAGRRWLVYGFSPMYARWTVRKI